MDLPAIKTTKLFNTSIVLTEYPSKPPTTVTTTLRPVTTRYTNTTVFASVTNTVRVEMRVPRYFYHLDCGSDNILVTANGKNHSVRAWRDQTSDKELMVIGHNFTRQGCCNQCMKRPRCRVSMHGPVPGLASSGNTTCSLYMSIDSSKCVNGLQEVYAWYLTDKIWPPEYVYSNGPCGQLKNGGDLFGRRKVKYADEEKWKYYKAARLEG
ncbi:hypothetical protein IL306_000539 [Fusarium sp. DS 682]|nr:hypothetical protein IL306_000539 [Fusarium sp. DS 682]